ncbi:MAG: hypothetical protein JO243_19590 [Solirubrobacterales bacterium]|nr:hypothetical protein [Solirubrobacterales bacterium]
MTRWKLTTRWLRPLALISFAVVALAGCGGSSTSSASTHAQKPAGDADTTKTARHTPPPGPAYPKVMAGALSSRSVTFVPAVKWHGQTAVSIAHLPSGVDLLSFDQRIVSLHLHSGTIDAGATGWRYGPAITGPELSRVVAAFNGGFRLDLGSGGFESYGRVGAPLRAGLGSIVTYKNGTTDIGSWNGEVPAAGQQVASVRQNLTLLVNHGQSASSLGCLSCWGATIGGVAAPARAALGIAANGNLIWAAGENLTPAGLADALLGAHVVRAVELDINPDWVAAFFYVHHSVHGRPVPLPVLAGQTTIPGDYLVPWTRDFFSVVAG